MKKTILVLLLAFVAMGMQAQLKHIKPEHVYLLPDFGRAEYERLFDLDQSDKLKGEDKKRWEACAAYDILYSPGCSWYCGGIIDTVTASSCLKPYKGYTYDAEHAHDFNHEQAWAEGVPGQGIGEYLLYQFPGRCPRITTVMIMNGYVKNKTVWRNNSRVKQLKMCYNGEPYAILDLEDSRSMQCFEVGTLGFHDNNHPAWTLKFEILDVYPGDKHEDTVISDLIFDGIDVH